METEQLTGTHTLAHEDSQELFVQVTEFVKDKQNVTTTYSTTPMVVGVSKGQAAMTIITSCLITWQTTKEDFVSFRNRLRLMQGV